MGKVIFIVLDGLNERVAKEQMRFMQGLVDDRQASYHQLESELPSLSRPLYETLLTGTSPSSHGILSNAIRRRSIKKSLFDLARSSDLSTGAVAYHWVSELYIETPYNPKKHRIQNNEEGPIQHGIFYSEDDYPDSHVFMDANHIINIYKPDFLMIHSMNIDLKGHKFGCHAAEYKESVLKVDKLLASVIPDWLALDYQILITADHGMDKQGMHGGDSEDERQVPLWLFSQLFQLDKNRHSQLIVAPLLCRMLGIHKSDEMINIDGLLY